MIDLSKKIALVTGAASGIGRASACALARAGATVVVSDVDATGGEQTVALISAAGGSAAFIAANVTNQAEVSALIAHIVARYGRLDCAHNNVGVESQLANMAEASDEDWDRTLEINLKGAWRCLRAELQQMQKQGAGVIVNTSSVGGVEAVPSAGSYAAAKHAIVGLTRTAAVEYAKAGIRVNAICPGLTKTPMTRRLEQDQPERLAELFPPMGRMAEPEEIGGVVAFLCSDLASYITGQAILIDGGATAI